MHAFLQTISTPPQESSKRFRIQLHFGRIKLKALSDTGAFSSAMSQKQVSKFQKSTNKNYKRNVVIHEITAFPNQANILYTLELEFKIGHLEFLDNHHNRLLQYPEFSFQLNIMEALGSLTPKRLDYRNKTYIKTQKTLKSAQLEEILTLVHRKQNGKNDRLSLAIPITDIYHTAKQNY